MLKQFDLIKERDFRSFFLGSFVSFFGSGLHMVAASWYIIQETGSSSSVGYLWFLSFLSAPLLQFYSGTFIDRTERVRLLVLLSLIRGVTVLLLPIAMFIGLFAMWQLYLLAFLNGIGFNIAYPTEKALVQEMIKKNDLLHANSFIEVSVQVGVFISAGVSGFIYHIVGLSGILLIDAMTFFAGAYFLSKISFRSLACENAKLESFVDSLKKGWIFMLARKDILLFGLLMFIPMVVTLSSNVALPAYIEKILHGDARAYGIIDMAYGIGAFAAGILAPMVFGKRGGGLFPLVILSTLTFLAFPRLSTLYPAMAVCLLMGISNTSLKILLSTRFMKIVPKEFMGRVMSVCMLGAGTLQLSSTLFVGFLADRSSPVTAYDYLGWLMALLVPGLIISSRFFLKFKEAEVPE